AHLKQFMQISILERSGPVGILESGGQRHNRRHKDLRENLRLLRLALGHSLNLVKLLLSHPLIDDAIPRRSALDPVELARPEADFSRFPRLRYFCAGDEPEATTAPLRIKPPRDLV